MRCILIILNVWTNFFYVKHDTHYLSVYLSRLHVLITVSINVLCVLYVLFIIYIINGGRLYYPYMINQGYSTSPTIPSLFSLAISSTFTSRREKESLVYWTWLRASERYLDILEINIILLTCSHLSIYLAFSCIFVGGSLNTFFKREGNTFQQHFFTYILSIFVIFGLE